MIDLRVLLKRMGLRENSVTLSGATPLVALATTVGMTLGVAEALRVLSSTNSISVRDFALLFTYATVGHGLIAAIFAGVYLLAIRLLRWGEQFLTPAASVGIGVASSFFIYFIWALPRKLIWLMPGCVFMAILIGVIVFWIASRITLLVRPGFWSAVNVALFVAALRHTAQEQEGPLIWYLTAIIAVLLLVTFLKIPPVRRSWLTNASLVILLGLMAPLVSALESGRAGAKSTDQRPNVLFISVDTLRSDRLGPYGYQKARTPFLDAFSKESALFEQATSPVPLTGPSHTSMLTGLYPVHHGALVNGAVLDDRVMTIADVLSAEGYRSAGFISGWTLKDDACGLAPRFNYYDEDFSRWPMLPEVAQKLHLVQQFITFASRLGYFEEPLERPGKHTTDRAIAWLTRNQDKPFFLFLHYFDPHSPHEAPHPYDTMHDPDYRGDPTTFHYFLPIQVRQRILANPRQVEHIKALYDGEISYVDAQIGRVLQTLQESGLDRDTLVVFTADHGESLTEHNFFFDHGEYLYETCVHVPLMIRFPHREYAGLRVKNQVRLVDLAPTILQITGVHRKLKFDGQTLLPILAGSEKEERVSYGSIHAQNGDDSRSRYYVRQKRYKLIWNFDVREPFSNHPAFEELYDLSADPGELNNLAHQASPLLETLRKDLSGWVHHLPTKTEGVSEEVKERLRALGYL